YADLYFQYTRSESYSLEEGIVKSGSFGIDQGVGVRAVAGDKTAFSYSDDISEEALLDAAHTVRSIARSASAGRVRVATQLAPREQGFSRGGGRDDLAFFNEERLHDYARQAVDMALVNLQARSAPAGQTTVVLGPGWPGILLHEAVGHGLEGDFNRKGSSAFA